MQPMDVTVLGGRSALAAPACGHTLGMATHRTALPWSHATHALLVRAVDDPAFLAVAQANGFGKQQLMGWVNRGDVPKTYRAALRVLVDDWYHRSNFAITGGA